MKTEYFFIIPGLFIFFYLLLSSVKPTRPRITPDRSEYLAHIPTEWICVWKVKKAMESNLKGWIHGKDFFGMIYQLVREEFISIKSDKKIICLPNQFNKPKTEINVSCKIKKVDENNLGDVDDPLKHHMRV